MHVCIYSQCINAFIYARSMHSRMETMPFKGLCFFAGVKKPTSLWVFSDQEGLAGVHAPPEDVTEDGDLLFLDLLEAVVLIRMLVAIEAAQADPCRQAIKLLHP